MKRVSFSPILRAICLGGFLVAAQISNGDQIKFTGSSGGYAASATFDLTGNTLTVTLQDLNSDNSDPAHVLTALLFNLGGSATLTPTHEDNSTILKTIFGTSTVVPSTFNITGIQEIGGNWAYQSPLNNNTLYKGANAGISTTGLNVFNSGGKKNGPPGAFGTPSSNLDGPAFGLVNSSTQPSGGQEPYIDNSLTFILDVTGSLSLSDFSSVSFVYGTSQSDANVAANAADGGSTIAFLGAALLGIGAFGRKLRAA